MGQIGQTHGQTRQTGQFLSWTTKGRGRQLGSHAGRQSITWTAVGARKEGRSCRGRRSYYSPGITALGAGSYCLGRPSRLSLKPNPKTSPGSSFFCFARSGGGAGALRDLFAVGIRDRIMPCGGRGAADATRTGRLAGGFGAGNR